MFLSILRWKSSDRCQASGLYHQSHNKTQRSKEADRQSNKKHKAQLNKRQDLFKSGFVKIVFVTVFTNLFILNKQIPILHLQSSFFSKMFSTLILCTMLLNGKKYKIKHSVKKLSDLKGNRTLAALSMKLPRYIGVASKNSLFQCKVKRSVSHQ